MAGDRTTEFVWGWQGQLKAIADRTKHILQKDAFSDVTFRVGPLEGPTVDMKAHKLILAMGSAVFETMFYGSMAETSTIVRISDMDEKTFDILLRYIYYDEMPPFDSATAFSTLYTAKKYGLPLLKAACEDFLKKDANSANCLAGFVQAKAYDEQDLTEFYLQKIDLWASLVLKSADFTEIGIDILKEIFHRSTLRVKEEEVLDAAYRWAEQRCAQKKLVCSGENCRKVLKDAMFLIRFPLLEDEYLAKAAKSRFLLAEEFKELYLFRFINEKLSAKFITRKRITPILATIGRFESDWVGNRGSYTNGSPDVISSQSNSCPCSASFRIYEYSEGTAKELQEFRRTGELPDGETGSKVKSFMLDQPVPLTIGQSYIISVQIMSAKERMYGWYGRESVLASAGDYKVTVRFWDAMDPEGTDLINRNSFRLQPA